MDAVIAKYVKMILAQMQKQKKENGIYPSAVSLADILNRAHSDTKRALWSMCKDGSIIMHKTLNEFSFESNEQ